MGEPDSSTAEFDEAREAFTVASEKVYGLRLGAYQLQVRAGTLDAEIRDRTSEVMGSDLVQAAPEGGPHNAETRGARAVEILTSDGPHVARIDEVNRLRADIAQNEAELERARDQRSVAQRRMDFAVAILKEGG